MHNREAMSVRPHIASPELLEELRLNFVLEGRNSKMSDLSIIRTGST